MFQQFGVAVVVLGLVQDPYAREIGIEALLGGCGEADREAQNQRQAEQQSKNFFHLVSYPFFHEKKGIIPGG